MTNSFDDIAKNAQCLFIIGSNTTEQHPVIGMQLRQAVKQRGVPLIVADPRRIPITQYATIHLRHKPGTDIALLNGLMHVLIVEDLYDHDFVASRTEGFEDLKAKMAEYTPERVAEITGVAAEDIRKAARLMAAHRPGALMYAMGITQHTSGHGNVMTCANLQMLLGNMGVSGGGVNPLRGQTNVQGACDMGGLPNYYTGYQNVAVEASRRKFEAAWGALPPEDKPGLTVVEMMHAAERGQIKAMYVVGENPALSDPDLNHVRHCLESLDFLVVQDLFLTETAQLADVVLPGASFAEKDGTFTNSERRVQLVRRALNPLGEVSARLGDHRRSGPAAADGALAGAARERRQGGRRGAARRVGLHEPGRDHGRDRRSDALATAASATTGWRSWAACNGRAPTRSIRARRFCTSASSRAGWAASSRWSSCRRSSCPMRPIRCC